MQTKHLTVDSSQNADLSCITRPFTLRKEQPQAIETAAGNLRVVVAERPAVKRIDEYGWIGYLAPDYKNKTVEYHVLLRARDGFLSSGMYTRTGSAIIYYSSVADVAYDNNVIGACMLKTAPENAKAALLSEFYPFGIMSERYNEYKNRGVGSALLRLIGDDCAAEGASFMYGYMITPEMQDLVREFGFEHVTGGSSCEFYLRLRNAR
jgi:GNAT superfamily N-acetyltransferase